MFKKVLLVLLIVLFFSTVAFAKTTLTLYTSVPKLIVESIKADFEKANPDIEVSIYRSGSSKVVAKLTTEITSGKISADVLWIADPSFFVYLKEKGLLLKYDSPELKAVPAKFKDPDNYFFGLRAIVPVITYNTNLVKPEDAPKKWTDLLDKKFKKNIIMPSPLYSGSNLVWLYAMTEKYGWKFIEDLSKAGVTVCNSNSISLKSVASGSYKVGVTLDYKVRAAMKKGSPVNIVYPEDGNVIVISPVAVFKTSKVQDAAKKFVDFVASKKGQEVLVKHDIIPVRTDVTPPKGVDLQKLFESAVSIDLKALKDKAGEIKDKFADIFE